MHGHSLKRSRVGIYAFTEGQHFAGTERGDERQAGLPRPSETASAAVVWSRSWQAASQPACALGNDGGIDFGGRWGDEAEIDAVFAAFLGDTRYGLRVGPNPCCDRPSVAMGSSQRTASANAVAHSPKSNAIRHSTDTTESTTSAGKRQAA